MRMPLDAGPRFLEDNGLVLVRGHMVRAEVVRTLGLDETSRQLSLIFYRKQKAARS